MRSISKAAGALTAILVASAIAGLCACTKAPSVDDVQALSAPMGAGTATLTWEPPRRNVDGSALRDLAGYFIYYGTSEADMSRTVRISDPYVTTYVIEKLVPGTYYFSIVAFNASGTRSRASSTVSKTIP